MKVVLDTNVILAAFGFGGFCRSVLEVCLDEHDLISSEHILAEVHRHLQRKLGHDARMAGERVEMLREAVVIVAPTLIQASVCRDPDDLPVLGTVLAGDAACLVTGDQDLLDIAIFDGRPIVSPRHFWERLRDPGWPGRQRTV